MPTGFDNENFNAAEYVLQRPIYQPVLFDLIRAWQEDAGAKFDDVLDLGCGPGNLSYPLTRLFKNVVGLDPSPIMIAGARSGQAASALNITVPEGHSIKFAQGYGENTNQPDASFDAVVVATAAHWMPWQHQAKEIWAELSRILRPGGNVIFAGYTPPILRDHHTIDTGIYNALHDPHGYGKYFELNELLSPTAIALSLYTTIPRPPAESDFDSSHTQVLLFNAAERIPIVSSIQKVDDVVYKAADLPDWALRAGVKDTENVPIALQQSSSDTTGGQPKKAGTTTLRQLASFIRTGSAWPRYLSDHPEEAELLKQGKQDWPLRTLDELRQKEARETGKPPLDWDQEIPIVYPASVYVTRKKQR